MIDLALSELGRLILKLNMNAKKTRKEQNLVRKIQEKRDTIQDALVYAKLKISLFLRKRVLIMIFKKGLVYDLPCRVDSNLLVP